MSKKLALAISLALGIGVAAGGAWYLNEPAADHASEEAASHAEEGHADSESGHGDEAVGPNGGEIHTRGAFSLELVAPESEDGSKPISIYLSKDGKPIAPSTDTSVTLEAKRASGERVTLVFAPQEAAFVSRVGIAEPHFFDAQIIVRSAGQSLEFAYSKTEGLLELTEQQIRVAGIQSEKSQPRVIDSTARLPGEIRFDEDRTAHVVPRIAGVVESVPVNLGDMVRKGQTLAVIASQQISDQRSELAAAQRRSELARTTLDREKQLWKDGISAEQDYLQARQLSQEADIALGNARQKMNALGGQGALSQGNRYELRAPFDGTVVEKHFVLGEVVDASSNAFTLTDLNHVWATFNVAPKDLAAIQVGKQVQVLSPELQTQVQGSISYIGSLLGEQTRTATARAVLTNPDGAWRPGLPVAIEVATASREVAVTIPATAVQRIDEQPQVFVRVDNGFVAQPVRLGVASDGFVEVTQGLSAGVEVAAQGSFILKSELGKGSADHAH
ncbi:cobalt-zinc-cadmium efflux system membrane fusion protein [Pseudomonas sp. BIGb0408]|uniref:Cobalt-zinc-cadmium efflux system membrane fusion protein n=1 Tax=Phytopseudomonas flavescens TaxID=29435 RepID=A0A7Z0BNZ3_9GAMM|nr:cobalt-zinc-cadmium efflux system membrane fusion protein [Pseudomonas sp. BIGb0408]NYH74122.1 cobalt-zinc-cadmium efflux system membrane fusion protein [Pseudomonas flavescens]